METKIPNAPKRIIPTRVTRSANKTLENEERYKEKNEMSVDVNPFTISNSPRISNIKEQEFIEHKELTNSNPLVTNNAVEMRLLEANVQNVEDYANTFICQGYMLPKGPMRTFDYLLYLQDNPECCPKVGTCNYRKTLRHITKFQMIRALKQKIPNDPVVQTLSQQRPPDKLWLEYIFGDKLPEHTIFNPTAYEERQIVVPGIEKTISTFGKFKTKGTGKRKTRGIFARLSKKQEQKHPFTDKLVNNLEILARRQEKFNEDQRALREDYAKTITQLKEIHTNFNLDLTNYRSRNNNLSISEMENMFNN